MQLSGGKRCFEKKSSIVGFRSDSIVRHSKYLILENLKMNATTSPSSLSLRIELRNIAT